MKRYCKNYKTTLKHVETAINKCLKKKWKRRDVAYFLAEYVEGYTERNKHAIASVVHIMAKKHRTRLKQLVKKAAFSIYREIKERRIKLKPVRLQDRYDICSGKVRTLGICTIKQQCYDYIAVLAAEKLWKAKFGFHQYASIKGKGPVKGKKTIERWIRKNPKITKYSAQGDIQKCYPSIDHERLKELLDRDIKNEELKYIIFFLIDTYPQGLCIGSYLSQTLANYFISYAYHYAQERIFKEKKHRGGTRERIRLVHKVIYYMDDFCVMGSRKADVRSAMRRLIKFMKEFLKLETKKNWILFKIDCTIQKTIEAGRRIIKRTGQCIDMMGYKIFRDHTEMRRSIFLKARKAYLQVLRGYMNIAIARKIVSYNGFVENTDSKHFKQKYKTDIAFRKAKEMISYESRVHGKTASIPIYAAA